MASIFFLLLATAALLVGIASLSRSNRLRMGGPWPRALVAALMIGVALFLVWLAVMILLVGPSMRET